jgi:serine/threonine-protein kinase
MFSLLSGEVVHKGSTINEALAASITQPARPIRNLCPDLPPLLAQIVDKALKQDKAERFADARSMREALHAAYVEATGTPMPATLPWAAGANQADSSGRYAAFSTYSGRASAASYSDIRGTSPPVTATHASEHRPSRMPMVLGIGAITLGVLVVAGGALGFYLFKKGDAESVAAQGIAAGQAASQSAGKAAQDSPRDANALEVTPVEAPDATSAENAEVKGDPDQPEASTAAKKPAAKPTPKAQAMPKVQAMPKAQAKPKAQAPAKAIPKATQPPTSAPAEVTEPTPSPSPRPAKKFDPFAQRD